MGKKLLDNFEEIIASLFLMGTTVLVVANIISRYFLKTGIFWSEEVATGFFVWSVFIGAAAAFKKGQHIGIDIIVSKLSGRNRAIANVLIDLVVLIVIGFITVFSVLYVKTSYTKPTPVLGVSSAYISSSIIVGFTFMLIRAFIFLFDDIKKLGGKSDE
ncbi:TRAP transporter small permease [Anaerococcus lactolyticus]|uniref:TRAP transporter, DctQ-like membrane protein n=2 Tax=Anaerococcus lactolyticus TaxID=33032 RepID=C2BFM7_9FIRM|nr:TRAP transporter small permease [Anaerococcus lactolyticus]EEI86314.1 TRAP transporter, DctQ-like membrane protein [Anaerococcus lactolyticus ATCC 51172]KGF05413.1 C4-dicarboxylate ABC transporter permease [Anaerococcus lactolyticus S7-1-13]